MSKKDERKKDYSKISLRIGEVQVELEGTSKDIKELMDKELVDFAKGLEATTKQPPLPTETPPKVIPKPLATPRRPSEVVLKEKTVPPPPSKSAITTKTPAAKPRLLSIEKRKEKTGKRKIGWKPVAISLALACIILSAGLVGAIAVYLPMVNDLETKVGERDTSISSLNSQVTSLNSQILLLQGELNQTNSTIQNLQAGIANLNSQIASYLQLLYLNVSAYLFVDEPLTEQNASEYTTIFNDLLEYAGYVGVSVQSTSNTTYVQLLYTYYEVTYDESVTVETAGTAYFPVLPGPVKIRVGNTDVYTGDLLNATLSVIYVY